MMTASVRAWTEVVDEEESGGGSLPPSAFSDLASFCSAFSRARRSAYLRSASSRSQVRRATASWTSLDMMMAELVDQTQLLSQPETGY